MKTLVNIHTYHRLEEIAGLLLLANAHKTTQGATRALLQTIEKAEEHSKRENIANK